MVLRSRARRVRASGFSVVVRVGGQTEGLAVPETTQRGSGSDAELGGIERGADAVGGAARTGERRRVGEIVTRTMRSSFLLWVRWSFRSSAGLPSRFPTPENTTPAGPAGLARP